jgi:hypothetical protein
MRMKRDQFVNDDDDNNNLDEDELIDTLEDIPTSSRKRDERGLDSRRRIEELMELKRLKEIDNSIGLDDLL